MERPIGDKVITDKMSLHIKPYEIKTYLIDLKDE
ncbi:hypothetical protein ACQKND_11620 [Viridibacillus arvi]